MWPECGGMCLCRTRIRDRFGRTRSAMLQWWCNLIIIFFTHELLRRSGTCGPDSDSPRRHCNVDNTRLSQDIFCSRSNGWIETNYNKDIYCQEPQTIYCQGKLWIEQDIESSLMRIQRNQECMQSMTERSANPNLLRLWVNTQVCIILKQNNWLHHNLGGCQVTSYGTEGWDIARTEIFEILFIILQD